MHETSASRDCRLELGIMHTSKPDPIARSNLSVGPVWRGVKGSGRGRRGGGAMRGEGGKGVRVGVEGRIHSGGGGEGKGGNGEEGAVGREN